MHYRERIELAVLAHKAFKAASSIEKEADDLRNVSDVRKGNWLEVAYMLRRDAAFIIESVIHPKC